MERALARWPRLQLLGRTRAPTRESPHLVSGWPSCLKGCANRRRQPFEVGLCPPGHADDRRRGPSLEGGHLAWSPSVGNEILSGRKISRHIFLGLGGNQGPFLVRALILRVAWAVGT